MFPPSAPDISPAMANMVPSQQQPQIPLTDASKSLRSPQVKATAGRKKQIEDDGAIERDLLREARERFRTIVEYEEKFRRKAIEELNFVDNMDHWKPEQREERRGLPCLAFDKIGPSCDQVVNNMRQSPPEGRISPVGEGSSKEEAAIIQGINRNIDQDCGADTARSTAFEHAVKIGIGWWRETFDWETNETEGDALQNCFLQKLISKRIPNPFSIYCDPAATEYDRSDMRYLFATEDVDPVAFKEENPDASTALTTDFTHLSDKEKEDWFPGKKSIRVAEYWWIESGPKVRVLMLSSRKVVREKDFQPELYPGVYEIGHRDIRTPVVKTVKMTGIEVLGDVMKWEGKWIPFVPVIGREVLVDGRVAYRGMIRPAMEANLAYDFMASKEAQAIALAPISEFIAAAGQVENHPEWYEANRKPHGILTYDPLDVNGIQVPAPYRVNTEANIGAITQALMHRDQDIKNSLNMWGPNLGEPASEQSGRAINAIQRQGDNAHFNYADNYARSIRHATRIRLNLMPHVYSDEQVITIMDPDGKVRSVAINKDILEKGVQRMWRVGADFNPARYDVSIGTGVPYASRLDQQIQSVLQLCGNNPNASGRALDLIAKLLDLPQEFIDRWRPPDVQAEQDGAEGQQQGPNPQQIQAQMMQQHQLIQVLMQKLTQLSEDLKTQRLQLESQERIQARHDAAGILKAEISAKSAEGQKLAQLDHDAIAQRIEIVANQPDISEEAQQTQPPAPIAGSGAPGSALVPPTAPPPIPPASPAPMAMQPGPPPQPMA
jgi:hypothetical protein